MVVELADNNSVIQRQLWLLRNYPELTRAQVYDKARNEFYELRLQEEVRRQVAKEEAMATGAYFGKSLNRIGLELEDKEHQRWTSWAQNKAALREQARAAGSAPIIDEPIDSVFESEPEQEPEREPEREPESEDGLGKAENLE